MAISAILDVIALTPEFRQVSAGLRAGNGEQLVLGLAGSQKAAYIAALYKDLQDRGRESVRLFVLTYNMSHADRLAVDLETLLGQGRITVFPPVETLPHEEVTESRDLAAERLSFLERLATGQDGIFIAPVNALFERLIPKEVLFGKAPEIKERDVLDLAEFARVLASLGYERVEKVESKGQFSIRGDILDVYPLTRSGAARIELFGDEVDSIRMFEVDTQRSTVPLDSIYIPPAREFLLPDDQVKEQHLSRLADEGRRQGQKLRSLGRDQAAESMETRIALHLEKLEEGILFEGIAQYKPFFYPQLATIGHYLEDAVVLIDEPARAREYLAAQETEVAETIANQLEAGRVLPKEAEIFTTWHDLLESFKAHPIVYLSVLSKRAQGMNPTLTVNVPSRPPEIFHGKLDLLVSEMQRWHRERYTMLLILSSEDRAVRVAEVLAEEECPAKYVPSVNGELQAGAIIVTTGALEAGFEQPTAKLLVLTDNEIFGRPKKRRRTRASDEDGIRITDFGDLKEGDYVVHINHGIGRYLGVQTLVVGGAHRDYLVVQYAGEDKLYVPTEQVDLLQRYIGAEDQAPKLNKLGGSDWARVKKRVKESVQELAQGLLELYAYREIQQGHAFQADTPWQSQFEDSFVYEETPDQFRAIEEVKRDMERGRPMDRLLCGDVGYGKTEVAIRAAFKAVMDGKQVAVLVPTTILAQQHYRTFVERFQGFPVKIEILSRFESAAEQNAAIKGVEQGTIDVIIGTHRLLSKDVKFKDLGVIIIDEEQRFGVAQKERLKELRKTVDCLTLTATPIPRTLHMALAGVRDMSVIETPPEGRFPIRTYVIEYEEDLIREAILRELGRDGQVYFVYNRIQSIDRMASALMELVPEARIAVAHGQMDEGRLEQVMLDFLQGEWDVLLCTTIIETGMDIANVNTLVVYDADRMGLAQLYQLRGRVGRSNRVAYAYFTYRKDKILTEDAEKRLQAIKEFTELGSGFKIAMRDLEIRGAGNILGPEQHGFIASVGFEMYCRLLDESVRELKGEAVQEPPDPVIDINVDAYLSDEYVRDSQQKVEMYKKIASVREAKDAKEIAEEIEDRFGALPAAVQNLLTVARIKVVAKRLGVGSMSQERDGILIRMLQGLTLPNEAFIRLARKYKGRLMIQPSRITQMKLKTRDLDDKEVLEHLEAILHDVEEVMVPSAVMT